MAKFTSPSATFSPIDMASEGFTAGEGVLIEGDHGAAAGCAVVFPFSLKDAFKEAFPTAKWVMVAMNCAFAAVCGEKAMAWFVPGKTAAKRVAAFLAGGAAAELLATKAAEVRKEAAAVAERNAARALEAASKAAAERAAKQAAKAAASAARPTKRTWHPGGDWPQVGAKRTWGGVEFVCTGCQEAFVGNDDPSFDQALLGLEGTKVMRATWKGPAA
jgi:hypothetical protein